MDQDQGVGREVKRLREAKGWSQTRLATEASMSVSGVSMIENGHRNLSTTTLAKLAEALEVGVRDLFPLGQAPLPDVEDERPTHSLQSWIDLILHLAGRWEREIVEREREWQDAKPTVRKMAKRLPNLVWANEIRETATNVMDASEEELGRGLLTYETWQVRMLVRAAKKLDQVIEQTESWYETAAEDAPKMAQVYDFREALMRIEKKAGVRAS